MAADRRVRSSESRVRASSRNAVPCLALLAILSRGIFAADQSAVVAQSSAALADHPAEAPSSPLGVSGSDVDTIRRALAQPASLGRVSHRARFYLEILGRQPSLPDHLIGVDVINSPTKGGDPMTHREFTTIAAAPGTAPAASGVGFDPVVIKNALMGYVRRAQQARIRARITREIEALTALQATAAAPAR